MEFELGNRKNIFCVLCFLFTFQANAQTEKYSSLYQQTDVTHYVNPLIGTAGEGYTYPGATTPWGMVSASPHTTYTTPLGYVLGRTIAPAGYYHDEPLIEGFGQTHLSGVACNELGAPVIAVTGGEMTPGSYASTYSDKVVQAGYYSVMLDDMRTRVSVTTTVRAVFYQFDFLNNGINHILVDAYNNLSWGDHEGFVEKIDSQTYSGWSQTGNFCYQGNKQKVYFYLKAITDCDESGLWTSRGKVSSTNQENGNVGAWLSYKNAKRADVIMGISYISIENAKQNLEIEIGSKDFETVLRENINSWESVLGRIKISDKNKEKEKELFYTSLYHALLHPNVVSDVNGAYPLYGSDGYGVNKEHPRYGLFSMWDSYRNIHALLSLFYPEQQQDMMYTLEDMTLSAGHAPRWELYGSEVNLMVGDPALSILSEGFVKGFKFKQPEKLFDVLYRNATDENSQWRPGNSEYLQFGYIPEKTKDVWGSVSTTLEYSYHDWALSQFALKLGRDKEASRLMDQSYRWRGLFDSQTKVVRPKDKYGKWISGFDPTANDDSWWLSLFVDNHGGPGFVEGNAYQYTYMVPHDINGLINLFTSIEEFSINLKSIFDKGYFTLSNEPDLIYPYLLGIDPKRITEMQQEIQQQRSTYTTAPNGIPGNDDAGTLSAWYVFTALGFYPVNPASGEYALGVPLFNNIQIRIAEADSLFRITADYQMQTENWEVVTYSNEPLDKISISHEQIINGGHLKFVTKMHH